VNLAGCVRGENCLQMLESARLDFHFSVCTVVFFSWQIHSSILFENSVLIIILF
jgi:hypothetical protein